MSLIFATGRSRNLTWGGDITDSFHAKVVPIVPGGSGSSAKSSDIDLRVIAYSKLTYLVRFTTYRDPNNSLGPGITQHVTATIDTGDGSPISDDQYTYHVFTPLFPGKEVSWDMSGSWEVRTVATEYCEIYDLSDVDPDRADNDGFPTEPIWDTGTGAITAYGSAYFDNISGRGIRFYEVIEAGETIYADIEVAGVTTPISISKVMGSDIEIGYGIWDKSQNRWSNETSLLIIEHLLNGVTMDADLSETVTATFLGGATGTLTVTGSATTFSGGAYGGGETRNDSLVYPPINFSLAGQTRCFTVPFPSSLTLDYLKYGGLVTQSAFTASVSDSWKQRYTDCDLRVYDLGGLLRGQNIEQVFQQYPVRAWLDVDELINSGDDSRDWRLQFAGKKFDVLRVRHLGDVVLDDCSSTTNWSASGGTIAAAGGAITFTPSGAGGSVTRTFSPKTNLEGHRYLRVRLKSVGTANQAVTVTLAGKIWNTTTGADGVYVDRDLDLLCASNETDDVEERDSRFPIDDPGGYPTNELPTYNYKLGWGACFTDTITIGGLPATGTVVFDSLTLAKNYETYLVLSAPFTKSFSGWDSGTDVTTLYPYGFLYADRHLSDWPYLAKVTPTVGLPYPRQYTIAEFRDDFLNYPLGWEADDGATPFTYPDAYHTDALESLHIHGNGATFDWTTRLWTDGTFTVNSTWQTIKAQALWDEVHGYPGCGKGVWDGSGYDTVNPQLPLAFSKQLRARAEGTAFHEDGTVFSGASIVAYETSTPSNVIGNDTVSAQGWFSTDLPYGKCPRDITTEFREGPMPYLSAHRTLQNRERDRTSFRKNVVDDVQEPVAYAVSRDSRHARAFVRDLTLRLGYSANTVFSWTEVDTGKTDITSVALCYQMAAQTNILRVAVVEAGTAKIYNANSEDGTLTLAVTIGTADHAAVVERPDGIMYVFRLNAGTVYSRAYDADGNALYAEQTTNLTGLDTAEIEARYSVGPNQDSRIGLLYIIGGTAIFKTSPDGVTFS